MPDLNPIIHATSRLRVMTTLATLAPGDRLSFTALQGTLGLTTGNLSVHLTKLEEAGYVAIDKTFEGRRPATYVSLTAAGRQAFDKYLTDLRALLKGLPPTAEPTRT